MTSAVSTASLRALLDTIDVLLQQHRAGITPAFGQVEDLREFSAAVRQEMTAHAPVSEPVVLERPAARMARVTLELPPGGRAVVAA
jgi:hypothetical protein